MDIFAVVVNHTHTHTHTQSHKPVYLDAKECAKNNGGCDSKRKCILDVNTVGSFKCGDCPAGYANDGAKGCKGLKLSAYSPL